MVRRLRGRYYGGEDGLGPPGPAQARLTIPNPWRKKYPRSPGGAPAAVRAAAFDAAEPRAAAITRDLPCQ